MNTPVQFARRSRLKDYILPALVALAGAGAAYAGADTTFDPALTKFTDFLEGSGGKIITVLSLAGGLIGLASGRFSLGQVAVPVRSEEHTSELQSLMRISYAVFCLKKNKQTYKHKNQ